MSHDLSLQLPDPEVAIATFDRWFSNLKRKSASIGLRSLRTPQLLMRFEGLKRILLFPHRCILYLHFILGIIPVKRVLEAGGEPTKIFSTNCLIQLDTFRLRRRSVSCMRRLSACILTAVDLFKIVCQQRFQFGLVLP